ncbi:hypothetical protein BaRGS_00014912, partial [Batillaria attramentaria]
DLHAVYNSVLLNTTMANMTTSGSSNSSLVGTGDELDTSGAQFWLHGVVGNILAVFGLFGNALSIVVLCNRRMRSSTSYYLISLAVYDNFILLSMVFFFNLPAISEHTSAIQDYNNNFQHVIPFAYPLSLAAQMGSIYTCVAFTIERFIAVCRPLHAANTCTKSRAKRAILLIFLWSMLYNVPRYFHYEIQSVYDNETGQHVARMTESEFGRDEVFQHVYIIYFQLFFMFLLPFLIILVLNTALVRAIKRSFHQRQEMSTSATREHNLTVMLVAVIIVFLVCQFPTIVDNILVAIVGYERHGGKASFVLFYYFCTFMVTINSSINFILYCLFGKKFRMVLCHILGLRKGGSQENQYRSTIFQSRANGTRLTTNCGTYDMEVSL